MNLLISLKTYKEIYTIVKKIVVDATNKLKLAFENNTYLGNIYDFPIISENSFGPYPTFSNNFLDKGPVDYTYIFSYHDKTKVLYDSLDGYLELKNYFKLHPRIAKVFVYHFNYDKDNKIYIPFINDIIERYLTLYQDNFDEVKLKEIFLEITRFYVSKKLKLEMWVPILLTNFQCDYFELDNNYCIKKLNTLEQLSRCRIKYYGSGVHELVMGLANFVLVRKNLEINLPKPHVEYSLSTFYANYFAKNEVDLYFIAQQMVCYKKSGYSQIIYNPLGWGQNYKGNLIPLSGFSIREYPDYFDDYVWLDKNNFIEINENELEEIKDLFLFFKKTESSKLKNALNRFRYCTYRTKEDDRILDAVIAMESLLDDNTQGEITFKISLRMSYIISLFNNKINPLDTFNAMKKIYNYRSNIVHGNPMKEKDNQINYNNKNYTMNELAIELLIACIKTIRKKPELLNKFDDKMIKGFSKLNDES